MAGERRDRAQRDRDRERPRTSLPLDRFDDLPKTRRVGAHRLAPNPSRSRGYVIGGLVGVALLTGVGIAAVQITDSNIGTLFDRGEAPSRTEAIQAELDPEATVAVLNGTTVSDLSTAVADQITENEWGQIGFSAPASSADVQISAVFYADPDDKPAALGLAAQLGGVSSYESQDYLDYGVRLVVLLGADYAGPGR